MKIIEATFYGTYPVSATGRFEKIVLKAALDEDDNVKNVLYSLKRQVSDFFYESNKVAEKEAAVKNDVSKIPVGIDRLKTDIESCKDLKILDTYKFIVKNNPELKESYDKKLLELKG